MKKKITTFIMIIAMFFLCNITAKATEMILYQLNETTDMKEQADVDSETVVSLNVNTPVLFVEEEQGWTKIRYQEYSGYVPTTALKSDVSTENLEKEFAEIEQVFAAVYQKAKNIEREELQETIWKVGILVLGILFFASAIVFRVTKTIREKREKTED